MNIINCLSLIDEKGNVLGYFGGYDTEDKPILVTKDELDKIKQFPTVSDAFDYLHKNQLKLPHYVVNGLYVAPKG
jgi:hypothetical protein